MKKKKTTNKKRNKTMSKKERKTKLLDAIKSSYGYVIAMGTILLILFLMNVFYIYFGTYDPLTWITSITIAYGYSAGIYFFIAAVAGAIKITKEEEKDSKEEDNNE
jgi:hypothetical protein